MKFLTADSAYHRLCSELVRAPRCGNTRELNNVIIEIKDITKNVVSIRDISPTYLFGELLWYFNGCQDLEYISRFSSFWERISDDGKTSNSAYGYLLQVKHGFNQIDKIVELLQKDPLSRRAVLNINVPNKNVIETKDEPCTIAIQYLVRDDKLNCTVMMRSNDIWFGTPYDWAFFMELQKVVADRLGLEYGIYTHFATSLHLYNKDYEAVKEISRYPVKKPIVYNRDNFHRNLRDIFVATKACPRELAKGILLDKLKEFDVWKGYDLI